jgi:BirA family transcriptional regulator, biotin operon repressor / biotin---[acetyl-CoA-carboxylase] ligase
VDQHCGKGAVLTHTVRTVAETGSTNADMLELARAGLGEGVWLRAERQQGGRGRQGRAWVSPVGNFYGSTLVRLRDSDPAPATLALVAAVALEEVVRAYLPEATPALAIKWPNDVLLGGAKLSGILLERTALPRMARNRTRRISPRRSLQPSRGGLACGAGRGLRRCARAGSSARIRLAPR